MPAAAGGGRGDLRTSGAAAVPVEAVRRRCRKRAVEREVAGGGVWVGEGYETRASEQRESSRREWK